jgi:hypothetical protein
MAEGRSMLNPEMKSFRLYLREPVVAPERYVEQISSLECEQLLKAFRPAAHSYRRAQNVAGVFFVGFLVCVAVSFVLPESTTDWKIGGAFICWLAGVSVIMLSPLRCPACRNNLLAPQLGPYCPECGARALKESDDPSHCSGCGRDIRFRKGGRCFHIRACTHCGVRLDERGL